MPLVNQAASRLEAKGPAEITGILLASASPFRRQLLAAAGVPVMTRTAPIDEGQIQAESPSLLAVYRATAKAKATAEAAHLAGEAGIIVIGCDQVMDLKGRSFDKVGTAEEALARLRQLSGQKHFLHSAYSLYWTPSSSCYGEGPIALANHLESVPMQMRDLSESEISAYIALNEWQGSVGCYQFENKGMQLFEDVRADQASIVGLPVQRLLRDFRDLGINLLTASTPPWRLKVRRDL